MDVICVAHQFEGNEKSDDRNGIAPVEEMRLHLRLNFLHHLGNVA